MARVWNIYKEVIADGWEDSELETNINEISYAIFQEAIENNKSQPFFPNAARDLFAAILTYIVRIGKDDLAFKQDFFNNKALKKYFDMMSAQSVKNMLETEADLASVLSYIGDGNSDQALGVFAELQSVVRKLYTGAFAKDGKFSVRNFVREKQGRTLFVEYDLSQESVLRKTFFSEEYMSKMDSLADEGVMMYFLETPDFPLLSEECDANYVLDSFIFGEYMSSKVLLESFFTMSMLGESMRRKQEDIDSAMCNMLSGYQRTAARN